MVVGPGFAVVVGPGLAGAVDLALALAVDLAVELALATALVPVVGVVVGVVSVVDAPTAGRGARAAPVTAGRALIDVRLLGAMTGDPPSC